jgi:hypothetical protein
MEPRFKTSFIPKQTLTPAKPTPAAPRAHGGSMGIMGAISITIFVLALASAGAAYAYKYYLESSISGKSNDLVLAREAFQPALIQLLERLDKRIKTAESLLATHVAPTAFFTLLENVTYTDVQFTELEYSHTEDTVNYVLEGAARDFDVVALQADVFSANRYLLRPIFSDLDVDGDRVTFSVAGQVDAKYISYANQLEIGGIERERITTPTPEPVATPVEEEGSLTGDESEPTPTQE